MDDRRWVADEGRGGGDDADAAEESSATGMFRSPRADLSGEPPAKVEDVLGPLRAEATTASTASSAPSIAPSAASADASAKPGAGAGEFTQFFQSLGTQTRKEPGKDVGGGAPAAGAAGSSTPGSGSAAEAGDFTRIFRKIPTPEMPASEAGESRAGASGAGSENAGEQPREPQRPATPASAGEQERPGEFTRLMQAISPAGASPAGPSAHAARDPVQGEVKPSLEGGAAKGQGTRPDTARTPTPAQAPQAPKAPEEGFTQMFQSLAHPQAQPRGSSAPVRREEPLARAEFERDAMPEEGGGFTRLFRALSEEEKRSGSERGAGLGAEFGTELGTGSAAPGLGSARPNAGADSGANTGLNAGPGEFTRLMHTLSPATGEAERAAMPLDAPRPVEPPAPLEPAGPVQPAGPGEYTRIISSSVLREGPGGGAPAQAAPQPSSTAGASGGGGAGVAANLAGAAGRNVAAGAMAGAGSGAHAPAQMSSVPTVPAAPPAKAAAVAPKSKLYEYLPLLLIANAFLMVVLILLVIFALRRH